MWSPSLGVSNSGDLPAAGHPGGFLRGRDPLRGMHFRAANASNQRAFRSCSYAKIEFPEYGSNRKSTPQVRPKDLVDYRREEGKRADQPQLNGIGRPGDAPRAA